MSIDTPLLVVGAGPHALTLLTYARRYAMPDLDAVVVADPHEWLSAWRARFAAHEIPMLRSACVHHPHPDPYALLDFGRGAAPRDFHGSLQRPGTALFDRFCDVLLEHGQLHQYRRAASVRRLVPRRDGVAARLSDGTSLTAARVVVASNPIRPLLPEWAVAHGLRRRRPVSHEGRVRLGHGDDVVLARDVRPGDRVLVVGGGLTAAQLALGACRRGAHVTVAHRSRTRARDLDVDATWLGGSLAAFHRMPVSARPRVLRRARGGGTLPPRELAEVRELDASGALRWREGARVDRVEPHGARWRIGLDLDPPETYDAVWLATGHLMDAGAGATAGLLRGRAMAAGMPVLAPDLSLAGTRVHLMGGLSALQTGAVSRTLMGARIASERLLPVLGAVDAPRQYPRPGAG